MTDISDVPVDVTTETTDPTDAPGSTPATGRLTRLRHGFTRFRRTRPFWGSLILLAGAWFIARPLLGGTFEFYTTVGVRSITPLLLAGGMAAAACIALVMPAQRHFPAIVAMMLAVASLPLANLGGWLIGMVLGITGAGLVFAWAPYTDKQLARFAERDARRAERREQRRARR